MLAVGARDIGFAGADWVAELEHPSQSCSTLGSTPYVSSPQHRSICSKGTGSHSLVSLAMASRSSIHVDVLRGDNDHHRAEAAFKATALALRGALAIVDDAGTPSTKGVLA